MDGLDVYIDDYGKPDPIPPAMLRALNQARTLRLFDRDDVAQTADAPAGAAGQGRPAPEVGPGAPGADAGGAAVAGPDPVDGPSPATDGAVPGPRTPSAAGALAEGAGDTAAGDVSSDAAAAGPPGPLATDASGTRSS
jgi:hypothetical protein